MRAKCFDITRHAVDAIAQHQPALLRCDALSTALLHHYFYRCRVLAAQKKWRERTQRRRKRLARTAKSRRVVGALEAVVYHLIFRYFLQRSFPSHFPRVRAQYVALDGTEAIVHVDLKGDKPTIRRTSAFCWMMCAVASLDKNQTSMNFKLVESVLRAPPY